MTISLRLNEEESTLIKKYAKLNGMSVSELMRKTILERIEDEYDIKAYDKALKKYEKDPITYSLDEVEKELGIK